jgi:hypothetical protein
VFTVLETPFRLLLRFIYDFNSCHYNYFYNVTRTRLTAYSLPCSFFSFAADLIWLLGSGLHLTFRLWLALLPLIWCFVSDRPLLSAFLKVKVTLRLTVSQSVSPGANDHIYITIWQLRSCFCGSPSLTRERVCLFICCWPFPAQSFSGPSPLGLATVFYCLRFETFLFVASYDSQGHGGGIRPRLHMGYSVEMLTALK